MTFMTTLIIAAAMISLPSTALHAQSADFPTMEVSYADLDLTSQADRATLDRRIDRAARRVCQTDANSRDLGARGHYQRCMARAKSQATQQIAVRTGMNSARSAGN